MRRNFPQIPSSVSTANLACHVSKSNRLLGRICGSCSTAHRCAVTPDQHTGAVRMSESADSLFSVRLCPTYIETYGRLTKYLQADPQTKPQEAGRISAERWRNISLEIADPRGTLITLRIYRSKILSRMKKEAFEKSIGFWTRESNAISIKWSTSPFINEDSATPRREGQSANQVKSLDTRGNL